MNDEFLNNEIPHELQEKIDDEIIAKIANIKDDVLSGNYDENIAEYMSSVQIKINEILEENDSSDPKVVEGITNVINDAKVNLTKIAIRERLNEFQNKYNKFMDNIKKLSAGIRDNSIEDDFNGYSEESKENFSKTITNENKIEDLIYLIKKEIRKIESISSEEAYYQISKYIRANLLPNLQDRYGVNSSKMDYEIMQVMDEISREITDRFIDDIEYLDYDRERRVDSLNDDYD